MGCSQAEGSTDVDRETEPLTQDEIRLVEGADSVSVDGNWKRERARFDDLGRCRKLAILKKSRDFSKK